MAGKENDVGSAALAVVLRFRRQVLCGTLVPGARLPSVRRLARIDGLAIHVAHQALQRIEEEGWARRRNGGYILEVAPDATAVAESQLKHEPPVVVTIISPKRIRGSSALTDLPACWPSGRSSPWLP
jgi:DNA-binding transcriptional MocR family regulator